MPVDPQLQVAENIIKFDGKPGTAAKLSYDVPLPGQFRGRRVIRLDVDVASDEIRTDSTAVTATIAALSLTENPPGSDTWTFDPRAAADLWLTKAEAAYLSGQQAHEVGPVGGVVNNPTQLGLKAMQNIASVQAAAWLDPQNYPTPDEFRQYYWDLVPGAGPQVPGVPPAPIPEEAVDIYRNFIQYIAGLPVGRVHLPVRTWSGTVVTLPVTVRDALNVATADASLLLIEVYGISSYLSDYGLGRTIRTFTLLPGEETRITMKTWRTDTTRAEKSSSIVDSYDVSSAERFTTTVQQETTDKSTRNSKSSWQVEAEVKAGWGWGSAKVSGGAAGEQQAAREQFSKNVTDSVREHSADASSNRTNTVTLSAETEVTTGYEAATERTIRNINLRRVLNFVFRELNQRYDTYVHLMDVKVGFCSSSTDSYQEVPLSGLRRLLEGVYKESAVDRVAKDLLAGIATITTASGGVHHPLERVSSSSASRRRRGRRQGEAPKVETAIPGPGGMLPAPPSDRSFYYRWKPGPIGQGQDATNKVDGIVMDRSEIVMPTSDLVVEALLGQADALDSYALQAQYEDSEAKRLGNAKLALAISTLEAIQDPVERALAWPRVFPEPSADRACRVEVEG